ncbi:MAG: hypothetical protein KJO31_05990 [Gammaproteobacteria bacterium]|nr:hypothetical protein [Gammaproteobacteria bacterium]
MNPNDDCRRESTFIYFLTVRGAKDDRDAWGKSDFDVLKAHANRLRIDAQRGAVLFAGRTDLPLRESTGIVVYCADSFAAAQDYANSDPAVLAGLMNARVAEFNPFIS